VSLVELTLAEKSVSELSPRQVSVTNGNRLEGHQSSSLEEKLKIQKNEKICVRICRANFRSGFKREAFFK